MHVWFKVLFDFWTQPLSTNHESRITNEPKENIRCSIYLCFTDGDYATINLQLTCIKMAGIRTPTIFFVFVGLFPKIVTNSTKICLAVFVFWVKSTENLSPQLLDARTTKTCSCSLIRLILFISYVWRPQGLLQLNWVSSILVYHFLQHA